MQAHAADAGSCDLQLQRQRSDYINASLLESPPDAAPGWRYIAAQVLSLHLCTLCMPGHCLLCLHVQPVPRDLRKPQKSAWDPGCASGAMQPKVTTPLHCDVQGPKNATAADFLQMVYEQQSAIIVMLTRTIESGSIRKASARSPAVW